LKKHLGWFPRGAGGILILNALCFWWGRWSWNQGYHLQAIITGFAINVWTALVFVFFLVKRAVRRGK
jgi:hypothetical protein